MVLKESKPKRNVPLDTFTREEFQDNILDKMNFRLVFLSIILPIVLIIGLVFGYFVMDYKIREKHTLISQKIDAITKNIEGLETFLSEQTSESKKSLLDSIATFNRTLESIQKDLKKQAAAVADLKKIKADKKTVSNIVKKELAGVTQSLDTVKSDVKKQKETTAALAMATADQAKTVKRLAENVAALSHTMTLLEESLKKQESAVQNLFQTKADRKSLQEQKQLRDKIQFIELELRLLKNQIKTIETTTIEPTSPSSSSKKGSTTNKDHIIEEEIIQ
jgi:chromosome segregation ATPase